MKKCALLLAALLLLGGESGAEEAPLKVGFIGSMSGPAAIYGEACRNGFELALQDLPPASIRVKYEDDRFIPTESIAAMQKLLQGEGVDLVVVIGSTPGNALAPLAQAKGVPLVAWASDPAVSRGRSLVVRSYPSGFAEGARAAEEAASRGYRKIALMSAMNDYAESWKAGFVASLPRGMLLVGEDLPADVEDFRSLILRARERGVKEYMLCLAPGRSGLFAKQARELGGAERFGGCEYLHDSAELKASAGALAGAWFPTIRVSEGFRERYRRKFGNESILSGAANHYDLAMLLAKLAPGARGAALVRGLIDLGPQQGAVGEFRGKEADDDRFFDIPLQIKEVPLP